MTPLRSRRRGQTIPANLCRHAHARGRKQAGDPAQVAYVRDGSERTVTVTLASQLG